MTPGWIHVITGCMFSGKTDELLRHLRRAEIAGRRIVLIRPAVDDRTPPSSVESRSGVAFAARAVHGSVGHSRPSSARSARRWSPSTRPSSSTTACPVCELLAAEGRSVLVSGPRPGLPGSPVRSPCRVLLALADQVTKLTAICTVCGEDATRTQRMVGGRPAAADDPLIVIGGMHDDRYEARCRAHHVIGAPAARSRCRWV